MKKVIVVIILIIFIIFSNISVNYAEISNEIRENIENDNNDIKVEELDNANSEEKSDISSNIKEAGIFIEEDESEIEDVKIYKDANGATLDLDERKVIEINDRWYMTLNGNIDYSFTGIATNENGTWYVENGEVKFDYTGIYQDATGKYIVEKSKIVDITDLMQVDGEWVRVVNGRIDYDFTGIMKNRYGTWYVINGKVNHDYTGTYYEGDNAYIAEDNFICVIVPKNTTKVVEVKRNEWRMVIDGKVDYDYTGIGENENGKWYLKDGKVGFNYTGTYMDATGKYIVEKSKIVDITDLMQVDGEWVRVVNGRIDYDFTGIMKNRYGTWYVINGKVNHDYTGTYYEGDNAYIAEDNFICVIVPKNTTKVVEVKRNEWRMVIDGKVDYNYTGLGENENGKWYLKDGKVGFNYTGTYTDATGKYIVEKSKIVDITDLMQVDGEWVRVVNGRIDYDFTGIMKNRYGTWYVINGKVNHDYTGTYYEGDNAYIAEDNFICVIVPKNTTKVVEVKKNEWRMVIDGKVDYDYTGIGENENGKWYLKDGKVGFNYTGTYMDATGKYIVEKSKIVDITDLMQVDGEWVRVVNGRIDYDFTGIMKNRYGTWYVINGKVNHDYTGTYYEGDNAYIAEDNFICVIVPKNTTKVVEVKRNEWRMVIDGKVDYNYTGLGENENGKWYLKDGKVGFNYTGTYTDATGKYIVEKSKIVDITDLMQVDGEWVRVVNGRIDYDFTGIMKNRYGTWYVINGKVNHDYTGTYYEGDNAYIAEDNFICVIVPKNTTKVVEVKKNEWRMVIDGKVDYDYTGIGENENGKWYVKDGTIDFKYNAECTDENGIVYNIVNNELRDIMQVPGYPSTMTLIGPNQNVKYLSDAISIEGWALSVEKNDKILIYIDGKYVGEAVREQNNEAFSQDINNEFGGIDSTPLPGFYFDLSNLKLKVGNHKLKVVNVASDGKTVMQTREVDFNVFALTKSKGIDVSNHQGIIDWEAVKNSGVTFAIIKIGEYWPNANKIHYDKYFERNYAECRRLGIAVGGYVYTYAFNSEEATRDANVCLDIIRGKRFDLPIYYDIEDPSIVRAVESGETTANMLTDAVLTFCNMIKNAGYQSGVYTYLNFFEKYLNAPLLEKNCSIWVAQWGNKNDYKGKYDLWQYSSDGSVPGISGRVDLDWYYPKK